MSAIDYLGVAIYFALLFYIGFRSVKQVSDSDDFAVAGNRITWPILFATLAASFLGGGASMGRAGQSFAEGYAFMFAASGFPIAVVLSGLFVAPRLKRYTGAYTVGDVIEHHYGAGARLFTGIFSLIFCVGILGAQALAIGTVFNTILGMSTTTGIVIGMVTVLFYSTFGGIWAVIQTDVVQFVMLAIFLPLTMLIGVHEVGGASALLDRLPDIQFSVFGSYSVGAFASLFVAFLLGETLVPPYTQRALSAPDSRNAKIGYTVAGMFGFVFYFVSATIGLLAKVLFPDITPDQALPELVRMAMPVGLIGLVLASLLAVVMSTADSYLNSSAVVFVHDIYERFIQPDLSERKRLWLERGVNLAIGVGAIVFALYASSIVEALLLSYSLWAPTVLLPFVIAVMWRISSRHAGLAAMVAGALVTGFWKWSPWHLEHVTGLTAIIPGCLANLVVLGSVLMIERGSGGPASFAGRE